MADIRHFYKDTTSGVFLIDGNAIPGGKYNMLFYSSDTVIEVVDVTDNSTILGPIEIVNLRKENDTAYTNKADLLTDVAELFESGGGSSGGGTAATTSSVATDNITSTNVQADKEQIDTKVLGYAEIESSDGTTVLTVNSVKTHRLFGITTHTHQAPVTSTLTLGKEHEFINDSTGIWTITSSGGQTITTLQPGETKIVKCISLSGTDASSWKVISHDSYKTQVSFNASVDLTKKFGYAEGTLSSILEFSPNTVNSDHGNTCTFKVNAAGYTPSFSGFTRLEFGKLWNPNGYNLIYFQKIYDQYYYGILPDSYTINDLITDFQSSNVTYDSILKVITIVAVANSSAKNPNAIEDGDIVRITCNSALGQYGIVTGLHTSNAFVLYTAMKNTMHISSDGPQMKYRYNTGSFISSGLAPTDGRIFQMRRSGNDIIWEYSDNGGSSFTNIYTYTDSSTLYIVTDASISTPGNKLNCELIKA